MNLEKLRKSKKLLQQTVADSLDIPVRTYSGYETGTRKPTPEMLCKLADYFDVTIDELLDRTPSPGIFDDARVQKPEVLELFESLTPRQQGIALGFLRELAGRSESFERQRL